MKEINKEDKVILTAEKLTAVKGWFATDEQLDIYLNKSYGAGCWQIKGDVVVRVASVKPPVKHRDLSQSKTLAVIAIELAFPEFPAKKKMEIVGLKSIGDYGVRKKSLYKKMTDAEKAVVFAKIEEYKKLYSVPKDNQEAILIKNK